MDHVDPLPDVLVHADPPRPAEPSVPPQRLVLLVAMLAVGALWLQHHLGFDFDKLGIVVTGGLVLGLMNKIADWIGESSAIGAFVDRAFKKPLRRAMRWLARPTPLYALAALLAVAMTTVSSVTVRAGTPGERASVTLASLDGERAPRARALSGEEGVARFVPVFTSPFGRLYRVDAAGYVPTQVTVYPLVARQLELGRDLPASPSVLFRPFADGVAALRDSGTFTVSRVRDGRLEQLAVASDSGAAFLIGSAAPITEATMLVWNLEATASAAPEAVRASLLVLWRSYHRVTIRGELAPRDCLVADIRQGRVLKERAVVLLTNAPFVDVLMQDVDAEPTQVPTC